MPSRPEPFIGLFTQSAFGIVLSMTIRLEKIPENVTIFAFSIKGDRNLIKTVEAFREIRQDLEV